MIQTSLMSVPKSSIDIKSALLPELPLCVGTWTNNSFRGLLGRYNHKRPPFKANNQGRIYHSQTLASSSWRFKRHKLLNSLIFAGRFPWVLTTCCPNLMQYRTVPRPAWLAWPCPSWGSHGWPQPYCPARHNLRRNRQNWFHNDGSSNGEYQEK